MSGEEVGCETDSSEGGPESLADAPPQVFALTAAEKEETDAGESGEEIDGDISNASSGSPESVMNLELAPFGEYRSIANAGNGCEPAGVGTGEPGIQPHADGELQGMAAGNASTGMGKRELYWI